MKLQDIWQSMPDKSDKGDIHSYIPVYEEIFAPYRATAKNILEIGIFKGHSLKMWEQYFTGKVYGIDCSDQPHGGMADLQPMIASGKHNIVIMDATDPAQVKKHFGGVRFDIIIDDASHNPQSQLKTFEIFKGMMNRGGTFIIEDIENIDRDRHLFESLEGDFTSQIMDRRNIKQRFDDVLYVAKFN